MVVRPADTEEILNIVNGRRVEARARTVTPYGWSVPLTARDEVAFALKVVHRRRRFDVASIIRALVEIGRNGDWLTEDDLRASADRTVHTPVEYMRTQLAAFNQWLATLPTYLRALGLEPDGEGFARGPMVHVGGVPTTLVLAGDGIVNGPWSLSHAVLANANALAIASVAQPLSTFRFVQALTDRGVDLVNLVHLDVRSEEGSELVRHTLQKTKRSVMFGEEMTISALCRSAQLEAGHLTLPFPAEGRAGVIVLADANVERAARQIVHGAVEANGTLCRSTKVAFVHASLADALAESLVREATLAAGERESRALGFTGMDQRSHGLARSSLAGADVLFDRKVLLARARASLSVAALPLPMAVIVPFVDEDPVDLANATLAGSLVGRASVYSVFTADGGAFRRSARKVWASKVRHDEATSRWNLSESYWGGHLVEQLMQTQQTVRKREGNRSPHAASR